MSSPENLPVELGNVRGLTHKEVLRLALHPLDLDFRVGAGYVFISSEDHIEALAEIRIYDVVDLAKTSEQLQQLAKLIPQAVEPEFWQPVYTSPGMAGGGGYGGMGSMGMGGSFAVGSMGSGGSQKAPAADDASQRTPNPPQAIPLGYRGTIVPWQDRYLIVRAGYPVQEKVTLFLEQLRLVTQKP